MNIELHQCIYVFSGIHMSLCRSLLDFILVQVPAFHLKLLSMKTRDKCSCEIQNCVHSTQERIAWYIVLDSFIAINWTWGNFSWFGRCKPPCKRSEITLTPKPERFLIQYFQVKIRKFDDGYSRNCLTDCLKFKRFIW